MRLAPPVTYAPAPPADPTRLADTALVVVHGMGRQARNQTLLEWAEPLLADIDGPRGPTRLSITEARWSESFLAMTRREVFRWGAIFVWRALGRMGRHFGRTMLVAPMIALVAAVRDAAVVRRVLLSLLLAATAAIAGPTVAVSWVVLALIGTLITTGLPIVGVLLVVPGVGGIVQPVVNGLVDFVGDVGVWRERPVRGAAMAQVVYRELELARDAITPDGRIVVLAHSQGAAIAANVIFTVLPASPGAPQVDTLLTVGAAVSLLGPSRLRRGAADLLTPVADWVASPTPVRWVNFWAIWDPFAAGPIADTHRARYERWASAYRAPAVPGAEPADDAASGPEERPVHNTAFPLTDHQGYAANTAQVIDPVARELAGLPPAPSVLRRRWVRIVKARGLARLLAIVIAVFVPFTALPSVVGGALYSTAVAVVETLGAFVDLSAVAGFLTSLRDGDHFTSVGATVVAIVVGLVVLGTLSWLGAWISHRQAVAVVSQIWSLPAWRIVDGAFRLVLVGAALLATDDVLSLDPLAWAVLAPIGIAVWAAPLNPAIPHDVPAQPAPPATQPVPPMPP